MTEGSTKILDSDGFVSGFVQVYGLRLRYAERLGDGPPLLICNGIGANLELAKLFARSLEDRHVVLFDLPGLGESDSCVFYPSMNNYSRFAVGVLDALGHRGEFHVAGVSWGGALAQQIARNHTQRVGALILMATSPGVLMVPGKASALLRMVTPYRYLSGRFMESNAGSLYGGEMRDRPDRAKLLASLTTAPTALSYMQQMYAGSRFTSLPWLHRIECPTLVMSGSDDPIIRTVNAKILTRMIPKAQLELMEGSGHLFMVMESDETAKRVKQFLNEFAKA